MQKEKFWTKDNSFDVAKSKRLNKSQYRCFYLVASWSTGTSRTRFPINSLETNKNMFDLWTTFTNGNVFVIPLYY